MTPAENIATLARMRELQDILRRTGDALGVRMDRLPLPAGQLMLRIGEEQGKIQAYKHVLKQFKRG